MSIPAKKDLLYSCSPSRSKLGKARGTSGKARSVRKCDGSSNNASIQSQVQEQESNSTSYNDIWFRYLGVNGAWRNSPLHSIRPYGPEGREFDKACSICGGFEIHDIFNHQKFTARCSHRDSSSVDPDSLNQSRTIFEKIDNELFRKKSGIESISRSRHEVLPDDNKVTMKQHLINKRGQKKIRKSSTKQGDLTAPTRLEDHWDEGIDQFRRQYLQDVHASRQKAYRELQRTGQRTRKPNDIMEVVSYLDDDAGVVGVGNEHDDRRNVELLTSTQQSNLDRAFSQEGLKVRHDVVKPIVGQRMRRRKSQSSKRSLEEIRMRSVETWLLRRGFLPR